MNGLKEWLIKCGKDKNFAKKFEGKNTKETAELAKKEGFDFTPEEFMDLKVKAAAGGGFGLNNVGNLLTGAGMLFQAISGSGNNNPQQGSPQYSQPQPPQQQYTYPQQQQCPYPQQQCPQ